MFFTVQEFVRSYSMRFHSGMKTDLYSWSWQDSSSVRIHAMPLLFEPAAHVPGRSLVVDRLRTKYANDARAAVTCIYCDYSVKKEQTPVNLLASIWEQLTVDAQGNISVSPAAVKIYEEQCTKDTQPEKERILDLITQEIEEKYSTVFIIVDALDERIDESDDLLLESLVALQKKFKDKMHFMLTSRWHLDLAPYFERIIKVDIMAKDDDLRKYLQHRIAHERGKSLEMWNSIRQQKESQEAIIRAVIESARGM